MSDIQGLLQHIQANPDDDVPRLVAADWYEEHGDAIRAGYIRGSVALARLPEWDRSPAEENRLTKILHSHEHDWLTALGLTPIVEWERGFPREIHVSAPTFLAQAEAITEACSAISLHDALPCVDHLAACTALERLRSLRVGGDRTVQATYAPLLASPYLHSLKVLEVGQLTREEYDLLGRGALLSQLEELRILEVENAGLLAFLQRTDPSRLRQLLLTGYRLTAESLRALGRLPWLSRLNRLELTFSIEGNPWTALADWPSLTELTDLQLSACELLSGGATALAASPMLAGVRFLDLSYNDIGDDGVMALARSPHLISLHFLDLTVSRASPFSGRSLADWPGLAGLRKLLLSQNALGDDGLRDLLASNWLSEMRWLDLSGCKLGKRAGAYLAQAQMPQLRRLSLMSNPLTDAGADALVGSLPPTLEMLDLRCVQLSVQSKGRLRRHFGPCCLLDDNGDNP